MSMILDYEPCDKCKEKFEAGIQIVEASEKPLNQGQPLLGNSGYPTGRWAVVGRAALEELKVEEEEIDRIEKIGHCMMTIEQFTAIFGASRGVK